jgi:hypothetical protein
MVGPTLICTSSGIFQNDRPSQNAISPSLKKVLYWAQLDFVMVVPGGIVVVSLSSIAASARAGAWKGEVSFSIGGGPA